MKLLYVALILPYFILGQVYDNFSDGDFTNNPTWFGLQNHFEIDSETSPNTILKNSNALTLIFYEALPINETFQLKLFNISDSIGNQMNDTIIDLYVQ